MFRFANIELLWLLVSVPVFIAAFILIQHRKRRQLEDFGDAELVKDLMQKMLKKQQIKRKKTLYLKLYLC